MKYRAPKPRQKYISIRMRRFMHGRVHRTYSEYIQRTGVEMTFTTFLTGVLEMGLWYFNDLSDAESERMIGNWTGPYIDKV